MGLEGILEADRLALRQRPDKGVVEVEEPAFQRICTFL
jgi:hypothetical protein